MGLPRLLQKLAMTRNSGMGGTFALFAHKAKARYTAKLPKIFRLGNFTVLIV
jgi:hypothetical protein